MPSRVNSDFGHLRMTDENPRSGRWKWAGAALIAAGAIGLVALAATWGGGDGEPRSDGRSGARSRFADIPKIDVHVHVSTERAREAIALLRRHGVRIALNASGGSPGMGLEASADAARATGGALRPYCNVGFRDVEGDFAGYVERTLTACKEMGAVGVKIFKALGLGITLSDGSLLRVDDPRLDPLFEKAGELGLPVLIHSGDPRAFFEPPTRDNERYDELSAHPDWSFYGEAPGGGPWPSWDEILDQFERRVARHPRTTFVGAHFGNAPEEPGRVERMLAASPRYVVETGARVPEIGRHPAARMRAFFERWQDRILFGTDFAYTSSGHLILGSSGEEPDPPSRVPAFFEAHWRYFETNGRGLAHPTPIQGRWTIDGIGLGRETLEKLYFRNAARVFGLDAGALSAPNPGPGGESLRSRRPL